MAYVVNFRYILFNTSDEEFDKTTEKGRENIFLVSSLLLLKSAYDADMGILKKLVDLWRETGYLESNESIAILLFRYILEIKENKEIQKYLKKGVRSEFMVSLAEQLREEGRREGKIEGKIEGEIKGKIEGKIIALQEAILSALEVKFGEVPKKFKTKIKHIKDEKRLTQLHRKVILADTLDNWGE